MKKEPIIEFKNVSKKFGDQPVLNNISFSVMENEIFGLLGRSGAGKTTLLHILLGLVKKDKGIILYRGQKIRPDKFFTKKKIGFAPQEASFYPKLSVQENLWYYGRMYEVKPKILEHRIIELLRLFNLEHARKKKASKLSGGMKRRLDLAISLIHNPDVIILDEPTTGLDVILSKQVWELINRIKNAGKTVIISTHVLHEVQKNCTSIGIISEGTFYPQTDLYSFARKNNAKTLEEMFIKFFEKK